MSGQNYFPRICWWFKFEKKIGSFGMSKFEKKTAQFSKLLADLPHLFFSGITFLFWGDCLKFVVSTPYTFIKPERVLEGDPNYNQIPIWVGKERPNQIQSRSEIRNEFFNQADPLNRGVCEDPGAPRLATEWLGYNCRCKWIIRKGPPNHSGGRFYPSHVFPVFSYVTLWDLYSQKKRSLTDDGNFHAEPSRNHEAVLGGTGHFNGPLG